MKVKLFVAVILGALLFDSCVEDQFFESEVTQIVSQPKEIINGKISGKILDEMGNPITDATVTLLSGFNEASTTVDDTGYYQFEAQDNKGNAAFITVTAPGKFDAFKKHGLVRNRLNYTEVVMMDKTIIGTVSTSQGGSLSNNNGAKIVLPAGGIIKEGGSTYSGNVNVAMAWIDPSSSDISARTVGDLSGITMEGEQVSLVTYGMLQVELLDDAGNELNLADGANAELTFPVPVSMQGRAPNTIPLWSFDEELGTWIEEGLARYENGSYVGEVSHFSSWNVDFMYDPISISGRVILNFSGDTVGGTHLKVFVSSENIGRKGGWLTKDGEFLFYNFPKNEAFNLVVSDHCGNELFSKNYGPYDTDTKLDDIEVSTGSTIVQVSGNAFKCDGETLAGGLIGVTMQDRRFSFTIEDDGTFQFTVDLCTGSSASVILVDPESQLTQTVEISDAQTIWLIEDAILCDDLTDFVSISIDGATPTIHTGNIQFTESIAQGGERMGEITFGSSVNPDSVIYTTDDVKFQMLFTIQHIPGSNTVQFFQYQIADSGYFAQEIRVAPLEITISQYKEGSGGFITGTFSGKVKKETQNGVTEHTIEGAYHVPIK